MNFDFENIHDSVCLLFWVMNKRSSPLARVLGISQALMLKCLFNIVFPKNPSSRSFHEKGLIFQLNVSTDLPSNTSNI